MTRARVSRKKSEICHLRLVGSVGRTGGGCSDLIESANPLHHAVLVRAYGGNAGHQTFETSLMSVCSRKPPGSWPSRPARAYAPV